ncbi:hypothetical protein [Methyloligella solikamskensis]|uniref:Peptidoglycan binding-like domain-containing protein n=1 Tax=Methyloligella solikamskensis TaxID=1177756 RepID=A0ABW3JAC1_9HYPH
MSCFSLRASVSRLLGAGAAGVACLLLAAVIAPASGQADSLMERMTRLARAGETACADPWTYSRGLDKCICIKAGYSKQWGQCLPMEAGQLAETSKDDSPAVTSALPPETTGALPEKKAPAQAVQAPEDPAAGMEKIARAQDCLSSLGLYEGAIDGEGGKATSAAYGRFAKARGLPQSDALTSLRAQAALQGACGQRWVSAKAE